MPAFKTYRTASGRSVSQSLATRGDAAEKSLGKNLYREAQGIMAASQGLVPVDTTALRSSGYVAQPIRDGNTVRVELGYGGPAARINPKTGKSTDAYALYVHENLEAFHPVGSAKYLELPFNQATKGMGERLANAMRQDLNGLSPLAEGAESVVGDVAEGDYVF